ncbi:MAG: hypothetical protein WBV06_10690 [Acidimicrobiia bacterium]
MTRKSVGYFEGTDSRLLSHLVMSGFDTLPVSNGSDHHGQSIMLVNSQNRYDVLVGYLHKIIAAANDNIQTHHIFHICKTYGIPLLLEVPTHQHESARRIIPDAPAMVELLDPADTLNRALELLA